MQATARVGEYAYCKYDPVAAEAGASSSYFLKTSIMILAVLGSMTAL